MKFQKTYKDFVNEIITEKISNRVEAGGLAFQKWMKKKQKKKASEFQSAMKIIAQAFLQQLDESIWDEFITKLSQYYPKNVVKDASGNNSLQITKFQFMVGFYKFYFKEVFKNSITQIRNIINQAAETIDIDKEDYSRDTIRQIKRIISNAAKNKNIFVSIFDSMWGY